MKKTLVTLLLALLIIPSSVYSLPLLDIGVRFGLSTPNNEVNNVYSFSGENVLGNIWREGVKLGYHIGANVRLPLSDNFKFVGGIYWHKFPQTKIEIRDPESDEILTTIRTTQNFYPITAGLNYYFVQNILGVYATGSLDYVYIDNSIDFDKEGASIPITTYGSQSRVGFGIGAGMDFDLKLLLANLEVKYNMANLIGKEDDEETKSYLTVSLGLFL